MSLTYIWDLLALRSRFSSLQLQTTFCSFHPCYEAYILGLWLESRLSYCDFETLLLFLSNLSSTQTRLVSYNYKKCVRTKILGSVEKTVLLFPNLLLEWNSVVQFVNTTFMCRNVSSKVDKKERVTTSPNTCTVTMELDMLS